MHLFDEEHHLLGGYGIVGGHIPLAAGVAFASKYRDDKPRHALLLRRGRGDASAASTRALSARRAVEAADRLHLREQRVLDGHAALAVACDRGRVAEGARLRHGARPLRRRRRRRGGASASARPSTRARDDERADAGRGPHLPLPRPLDERPGEVPHAGRARGAQEARPARTAARGSSSTRGYGEARARGRSRPPSRPRSRTP